MRIDPQAQALNETLQRDCPVAARLLSKRGKQIFFPWRGILGQSKEAKGTAMNGTIGIALDDRGAPLHPKSGDELLRLPSAEVYPYAPSQGLPELREIWRDLQSRKNPSCTAPRSLPLVTSGLSHALSIAGYLFLDEGDAVLLPDLHWENCQLLFGVTYGAELKTFPLFSEDTLGVAGFTKALSAGKPGKKIVLLNFPNNPSGYVPLRDEAKALRDAIVAEAERGSDVLVILDDAYAGFVYTDDAYPESSISLLGDCHENVLVAVIDGASKEDFAWGHRIGFITFGGKALTPAAAKALEDKAAGVVRATTSSASHVAQSALVHLYRSKGYDDEKKKAKALLQARYDEMRRVIESHPEFRECFTMLPSNAGYFCCFTITNGADPEAVRLKMLDKGAGIIRMHGMLRVAFSSLATKDIEPYFTLLAACVRACATR